MRRWQAMLAALEDGGHGGKPVVDALQTKEGKAAIFTGQSLLYVDVRRRRLRWAVKLAHLTTVSTHGAESWNNPRKPQRGLYK